MKLLNDYRMRFVLVGFVAAIVLGGGTAKADFTFGEITNLSPTVIDKSGQKRGASLSADGLTLFFSSTLMKDGTWDFDLYMVARETLDDDWGPTVSLGPTVNSARYDQEPSISTDGLELYFSSGHHAIESDLWVTKRETINSDWGIPVNLGPVVNSATPDGDPSISGDGLELYFSSKQSGGLGGWDIWVTHRPTKDDPWQAPVNLESTINSSSDEYGADITANGLTLIFTKRPGKYSSYADLWATTRRTTADPWREPFNLGSVINTDDMDWADVSPDGTTLFLSLFNRPGGSGMYNIWQTPIIPIVDLNGDGIVDADDMCIMVDNWGTDESLCDIAPMPFGDSIVDIKDLIALSEHLFEEFPPAESIE